MPYYTKEDIQKYIESSGGSVCLICRANTCSDDCENCSNECPCKCCSHNPDADRKSRNYGDKFSLPPKESIELNTREDYLNEALKATVSRGNHESTLPLIAKLWSAIFDKEITPHMVACAMISLKLARISREHEPKDSFVDIAGYAAIGGEAYSEEHKS